MKFASMLGGLAILFWIGLGAYLVWGVTRSMRQPLGKKKTISAPLALLSLALAVTSSTLSTSIVVVDAGEVGVVFNAFTGTQETPLMPGMHVVTPYINTVYRYSTMEQVYTMSKIAAEGQVQGEAESLRLVSQALSEDPDLLTYRYIDKLAPNIQAMILPAGNPFILELDQLKDLTPTSAPEASPATPRPVNPHGRPRGA